MTVFPVPIAAEEGLAILGPATRYLFQGLPPARLADPAVSTPCPGWNLIDLLRHLHTSLGDFVDILGGNAKPISQAGTSPDPTTDPIGAIQNLVIELVVCSLTLPAQDWKCEITDRVVSAETVLYVAATEMVLHSWDIAQTCGSKHPIPDKLARTLLPAAPRIAEAGAACGAFAAPISIPTKASPGRHFLALYGRREDDR